MGPLDRVLGFEEADELTGNGVIDFGNAEVEPEEAMMEAVEAFEEVTTVATDLEVLTNGFEAIEHSIAIDAELIAKGKMTPETAVVGFESFKANLKMLGVDPESVAVAGFEEDGGKGEKEGWLGKIWGAIKTGLKKLWEAVVRFVEKVSDFIASLFGKRARSADSLKKLLEKVKEAGKDLPKDAKFSEGDAKTLANNLAVIETVCKTVDVKGIECFLKEAEDIFATTVDGYEILSKTITDNKDEKKIKASLLGTISSLKSGKIEGVAGEVVKNKIKLDNKYVYGTVSEIRPNLIKVVVLSADKKRIDEIETELNKDDANLTKVINDLRKAIAYNVVEVRPDKKQVEALAKKIQPVDVKEAEQIVTALEKASKPISKTVKDIKKVVKETDKQIKDLIKIAEKDDLYKTYLVFLNKVIIPMSRAVATGAINTAAELTKSRIAMLVTYSVKLYTKS